MAIAMETDWTAREDWRGLIVVSDVKRGVAIAKRKKKKGKAGTLCPLTLETPFHVFSAAFQ